MNPLVPAVCVVAMAALCAAGCAEAKPAASSHVSRVSHVAPAPVTASFVRQHFGTPQQAMTYLAAAYNRDDVAALHYVTTPAAFQNLMAMRSEAVNLQLRYCSPTGHGDYTCYFRHDYPKSLHRQGHGSSEFIAAPALTQGWYMYFFEDCG
jgi:hypothetical protein